MPSQISPAIGGRFISTQSKANSEEFPFPRSCSSPLRAPDPEMGSALISTEINNPKHAQGDANLGADSTWNRMRNVGTAPSPNQIPKSTSESRGWQSPSRPSTPTWEHPESVPWVHPGISIGKMSPTPDGPKGGSDIPRVLLGLRGKSPGTGHGLEQPHSWGWSRGSPPPVPSPGSSMSARKRGILGTQRPPGAASPQNLTPPLCAQKELGWSLGELELLLTSSSLNPTGQSHIPVAPETLSALPTSQTRRKIGFEQQTGARLSPVPVPLSLEC